MPLQGDAKKKLSRVRIPQHDCINELQLPVPVMLDNESTRSTIRIDLPGGLVVHWPMDRMPESVNWLKALMP